MPMKNLFSLFRRDRKGVILEYGSSDPATAVPPEEFGRQMSYLKQKGYKVIALSEMCARVGEGRSVGRCVAITFDHGHAGFFKNIFPILKRYGFPSAVFLDAGRLGTETLLSEGEVRRASANDLIEFLPRLANQPSRKPSLEEIIREINAARTAVEALTGKPADILLYPQNAHRQEIREHLRKSGAWTGAVTFTAGPVKDGSDPFLLNRISVAPATSFAAFKKALP